MTEQEWLECNDLPNYMMGCLGDRPSERQLRLFACAMVRQVWDLLTDPRSRRVVEVAEQFADGLASRQELDEARSAAEEASDLLDHCPSTRSYPPKAATAAARTGGAEPFDNAVFGVYTAVCCSDHHRPHREMLRAQTGLLRDIFRNPFRPLPAVDPSWLTWNGGTVRRVAATAYAQRASASATLDRGLLGILADALEEAGCADPEILGHCRSPLDHVRGCWVLDLLLGKEDHAMTEPRWAESTGLAEMFRFLWDHRELSRRKQLLFGAACCRRIWHRLTSEESRWAVEVAEYAADGFATVADLEEAADAVGGGLDAEVAPFAAYYAATCRPIQCATFAAIPGEYLDGTEAGPAPSEQAIQRAILRCLVGNPFRPGSPMGTLPVSHVVSTAQAIYDERAFDRLPILADALEEADCSDAELLAHLRSSAPHALGCWALDSVLGMK